MTDTAFSSLVPRISASVPGCPVNTITQAVRDSARRTCERTLAYRYTSTPYILLPGVFEYEFVKPENTDAHAIVGAMVNNETLPAMAFDAAKMQFPEWADLYSGEDPSVVWSETPSGAFGSEEYNADLFNSGSAYVLPAAIVEGGGAPRAITQVTVDKYAVLPLPDGNEPYTMRMFLALKPKRSATGMNSVAFDELEDAILHGALESLLILPSVQWSDRELAGYHAKQYVFHIAERRARTNLGTARGSLTARSVPFG